MAKDKSFSAKVAKSKAVSGKICPVCKDVINTVQFVRSVKNEETGSYRFPESYIGICKCNEKEIYS